MQGRYEFGIVAEYAYNLIHGKSHSSSVATAVMSWAKKQDLIDDGTSNLDRPQTGADTLEHSRPRQTGNVSGQNSPNAWHLLVQTLRRSRALGRRSRPSLFQNNLQMLAERFGLDELERRILFLVVRYRLQTCRVQELSDALTQGHICDPVTAAARMLRTTPNAIVRRTMPGSRLFESGLVRHEEHPMPSELPFTVSYRLITACNAATTGYEAVLTRLVGKPAKPTLAWEDYDHIGADRDFVAALLEGAAKRREKGVNILVYGPPGTGKTEFCKTVVGRLGLNLYAVADDDGRGNEPSRDERIAQIRMSESVLTGVKSATLLFDEMEDLLSSGGGFTGGGLSEVRMGGSKAFVNRMLELNRIPVFWTSNTIRAFDPAFLRRMTFALEIKAPNAAESERVLSKVLSDERVAAEPHEIRRIAREFSPAPAIAASAAKAARLSNGEISGVRRAIRAAQKAMRGGYEHPPRLVTEHRYDPRLLAANLDLAALADKLCAPGVARNYSLCLYGPPGTGKTAFVRHLTERLDMALMHKRASDLMSCYVGGTERNIAGTFADARDSQSVLVIDEADSFLRDRSDAVRSWEVTQVNEMLTWMECHPLPFACTTNLMQSIDRAALRRFTFKVHLDYLRPSQIVEAFRLFFNLEAPKATVKLPVLTPGDFAVVARKARFLGEIDDAAALARMLDEECEAKPDWPRQIGFAA